MSRLFGIPRQNFAFYKNFLHGGRKNRPKGKNTNPTKDEKRKARGEANIDYEHGMCSTSNDFWRSGQADLKKLSSTLKKMKEKQQKEASCKKPKEEGKKSTPCKK